MDRLTLALAWPRFIEKPLRAAKREALCDHVAPVFAALRGERVVEGWTHVFWGDDELGTKVIRVTAWGRDGERLVERLREHFNGEGLEEGREFRVALEDEDTRREQFWGEYETTWLIASDALSDLAVAAIEGELRESLDWHVGANRPGHVWANQLGLTYMDEAAVYQRLALGYFEHAAGGVSDEGAETVERIRESMQAALDALPDPDSED
jgi:hypothetical protein